MDRKPKRNPSFFKVLIGDYENKLRIPPAFVKNFGGNVPTNFTLETDAGSTWRVTVKHKEVGYFFCGGWSTFVKDHCLEEGDFLVFFWLGCSTFEVLIYNRTACEKDISLAAKKRRRRPAVNRQIEETSSIKSASCSKIAGVSRGRRISRATVRRAKNVSRKVEFVSEVTQERPTFLVVLKEYQKYYIAVPRRFVIETGLVEESSTVIKDTKGGIWLLNVVVDSKQVRLGGGWSKFLQENEIVVGDTLLFQHIPNTGNSIHFQIIRKAGYRNSGRRNKRANACENYTGLATKRQRGRPLVNRRIEEIPSKKSASSSKIAKGVDRGCTTIRTARNVSQKIEIVSEVAPERLSFVVVLKDHQKYGVAVPGNFARETGLIYQPSAVIKNPKGRKWPLKITVNARSQVRLSSGWSKFLQENEIVVGDTLLFKHIPNTGNSIDAQILIKAADRNSWIPNKRAKVC